MDEVEALEEEVAPEVVAEALMEEQEVAVLVVSQLNYIYFVKMQLDL